jgi:hypothetical protein
MEADKRHFFRDPNEWQGMLVNRDLRAKCRTTSDCGLAASCINNLCSPCEKDSHCLSNEKCVLDHCVLSNLTQCSLANECDNGLCILSGYSNDLRNNSEMSSYCLNDRHGEEQDYTQKNPDIVYNKIPTKLGAGELREIFRKRQKGE